MRQRINKDTGVPVRPSMHRRMQELRQELGKTKEQTQDHWAALQNSWRVHEARLAVQ